uniref:DUF5641 domain-containing protein n=1 Tax=Loa loa TaxID=7209 RepID=A0A1I7VZZ9_LOALO
MGKYYTQTPWSGGVYERMIGLTKGALKKAIGRKLLWEREFVTLTVEIEGILNTRPLTYLNFDDYRVIGPIDFISPYVLLDIPTNEDIIQDEFRLHPLNTKGKLVNYWSNILKTLDVFWEIWKNEYLSSLRERTQREIVSPKRMEKRTPRRDEIVLLNEPGLPRGMWKLVKIQELNTGMDGRIRSVMVQTPNGKLLKRPINLLYSLEVEEEDSEEIRTTTTKEEPIALRTRGAQKACELIKSSTTTKNLLLITTVFSLFLLVFSTENCKWISGIPFSFPQKWNCDDQFTANFTINEIAIYTKTHVRIPALKCNNITHMVCTKAFLRISLSVESDQTTISAVTSHFCKVLVKKRLSGKDFQQISPNQWRTVNNVQYSYGWFGIRCQSTTNSLLQEGEIFIYDGKETVSDLDTIQHCLIQSGKCITNTSIVLWNETEAVSNCLYRKIGNYQARVFDTHIIVDELQMAFTFKSNETIDSRN